MFLPNVEMDFQLRGVKMNVLKIITVMIVDKGQIYEFHGLHHIAGAESRFDSIAERNLQSGDCLDFQSFGSVSINLHGFGSHTSSRKYVAITLFFNV